MLFWFCFFMYILAIGLYLLIIGVKVFKHKTIVRNEETLFIFCYCLVISLPYTLVMILTDKFNLSLSLEIFFRILLSIPILFLIFFFYIKKYNKYGFSIFKYIFIFNSSIDEVKKIIASAEKLYANDIKLIKLSYFHKLYFTMITLKKINPNALLYKYEWFIRDNFKNKPFKYFPKLGFYLICVGICLICSFIIFMIYLNNMYVKLDFNFVTTICH